MINLNLDEYYNAGYLLVEIKDRTDWMNDKILPHKILSASSCICDQYLYDLEKRFRDNINIEEIDFLINHQQRIPSHITEMTNINQGKINDKPTINEVLLSFINFIGNDILFTHNSDFDMRFLLYNMFELKMEKPEYKVVDTVKLSKTYFNYKIMKKQ